MTVTYTPTPTFTLTSGVFTATNTVTPTPSTTPTFTHTSTPSFTYTQTVLPTSTPSWTSTVTSTVTFTYSPTVIPTTTPTVTATYTKTTLPTTTRTATPSNGVSIVYVAYPNPVAGTTISLYVPGNFPQGSLKIIIDSVSMRLIKTVTIPMVHPGSTITISLLDRSGVMLSNGLYYLQLTASNGKTSVIKLLVLR